MALPLSQVARRRLHTWLAICIVFVAQRALALDPNRAISQYMVDFWQESSGLPQNNVKAVLQTADGYLWVGTNGGLSRFDGVRFVTFDDRNPKQLKEAEVWAVAEADDGLWIGTFGGGLYRFANGEFKGFTTRDGLPSDFVRELAKAGDGSLWIATDKGLGRRSNNGRFQTFTTSDGLPSNAIRTLHVDKDGVVWVGTGAGLAAYVDGRFVNYAQAFPGQLDTRIVATTGNAQDGIWVATSGEGLTRLKDGVLTTFTTREGLPSDRLNANALRLDSDGTLWVGTDGGLCRYRNGRFEPYFSEIATLSAARVLSTVSLRHVQALTVDREGSLWVGTAFDGLARLRDVAFSNLTVQDGLPDSFARLVYQDRQGATWIGTPHGLVRLRGGVATVFGRADGLTNANAEAMVEAADGTLWIGTQRGLNRMRGGKVAPVREAQLDKLWIEGIVLDAVGNAWVGTTSNGLIRYRNAGDYSVYTTKEGLAGDQVRAMAGDSQGNLWIGTNDGGVNRLRNGRFIKFTTNDGLGSDSICALYVDREDIVWVATRRGLSRIRENRIFNFTTEHGLPFNFFYQIVEDDQGWLWLTHSHGIARVLKRDLDDVADGKAKTVTFSAYGTQHGLGSASMSIGNQPAAWKDRQGRLWFAHARGVALVDPAHMPTNTVEPPLHIEEIRVDSTTREIGPERVFPPGSGDVEIHYTGLSFVAPDRVRFRYKLEDRDTQWTEAGTRRVAYYTGLRPGTYRFHVQGCNNDGLWSKSAASVSLVLEPHWYQTYAWWTFVGLVLCGLTFAAYQSRFEMLQARQRELTQRVEERTGELNRLNAELEGRVTARTSELEEEKERLAVTLRSIGDGVIATDVEGRVRLMNRVAEELTGWPIEEAYARPFRDVLPLVDRETRQPQPDPVEAVLTEGHIVSLSNQSLLVRRDGREILLADSAAPIRDRHSVIVGAVLVFRDVTEKRKVEEQLQNSQKLEALGILAGGIAHDFNNLLTGVFGYVDLARRNQPDVAKVQGNLDKALSVLDKARGLTGQLLTFSRAGQPATAPLELGGLLRKSATFALSGSSVSCEFEVARDLWACLGDERQIDQVVDNLLLNARQSMPGGGMVTVSADNVCVPEDVEVPVAAGRYVRVRVRDQGSGIPLELYGRIFEPFFTTKVTGSGLGLATAYSIARKHNGHIDVASEMGVGSTFSVYLPASSDAAHPGRGAADQPPRGEGRILLLDDEEYVRDVASQMLATLGYSVEVAARGEQAIAIFEQARAAGQPFDLVILDLTVPGGIGGVAVLARLRQMDADVLAVASSGYSGDLALSNPAVHGFSGRLAKPYTMAEMGALVARLLSRDRSARDPAGSPS